MDNKIFDINCITMDGRMDEPVWETVPAYTGFTRLGSGAEIPEDSQTIFKFLPCEDRIFVGVKCMESEMDRLRASSDSSMNHVDAFELFIAPSGSDYDYYQFFISAKGSKSSVYWEEAGVIRPDPYAPYWDTAIYYGDNFWSAEIEIPFTALYMTPQDRWTNKWLVNIGRTHMSSSGRIYSTWSPLKKGFNDSKNFRAIEGFTIRDPKDALCISSVTADITSEKDGVYCGDLKVLVKCAFPGEFEFTSDHAETVTVQLKAGINEFTAPCFFDELTRFRVAVCLKRVSDGVEFKRRYPVIVTYEPIVIKFSLPEFRTNFYPGQDHSKIVGTATSSKAITLKLEGPGIETQTIAPNADGSFSFETPNFEFGDAILTAAIDGYETTKKIRNLPPTGRMMSWISGGNLIVNGEPVLRRNMYAEYYMGGEAFKRKYDADNLYMTKEIRGQSKHMEPGRLIKGVEAPGGEATLDKKPTPEMLALIDKIMDDEKDRDFAFYYISDEPECRGLSRIYLQHMYDYITDRDPYHVVLTASRNAAELVGIADWFETHPYINPCTTADGKRTYGRNINTLGKFVDDIVKLDRPDKCIGFLPTCFAGMGGKPEPYPTFDEYICHTWAAMIHGGKTLYPYAYHDMNDRASMYEGTRYIFSSFAALDKLILLGKRTELVKTHEVHGVLYDRPEEQMFVLVNMTNELKTVVLDGISGTWHHFRHNETIAGNTFELKPLEVIIGTSQIKDAGLPTYQETDALINKLEYERTHTGSLLFEHHREISVNGSYCRKLFDGVRDNLAWTRVGDKEKVVELNLTKVAPTFTKIVVSGWGLQDMVLKVRNGEEFSFPEFAEVKTEEFSVTYLLKDAISPDGLRFEFNAHRVELYEIEVF